MEKLLNFRKLADGVYNSTGQRITKVYRCSDTIKASSADLDSLVEREIFNIIDLRSERERDLQGVFEDERFNVKHIDIMTLDEQNHLEKIQYSEIGSLMMRLYSSLFVTSDGFKAEFEYILQLEGAPFMFHCTAGKDRTGITGAILMYVLGFDLPAIREEYLTIDRRFAEMMVTKLEAEFDRRGMAYDKADLKSYATVMPEFIEAYYDGLLSEYGSIDYYIEHKVGLSEEDIMLLRDYYLLP